MFLYTHRHGNLITRELAVGLCPLLSLVVRSGRSAAQILQSGPRQLDLLGCAPCAPSSVLAAQQPKCSKSGPRHLGLLGCAPCAPSGGSSFGRPAAQILQSGPRQLGLLGCAPCSPSGGPFWPLSGPNPPKRTSPARSAWLCSLLSLWWSVLAAQQPKSSKTDLASLVCLAVLLALPLAVRFGRSAAQILQNGPSLAWSAWLCSLLSLWWSVLSRSTAQILQNGPPQLVH